MTWNYRVIYHYDGSFAIHEVYYNDLNEPDACSVDPIWPCGETPEELKRDLERMLEALSKPSFDYSLFQDLEDKKLLNIYKHNDNE